eukprot:TRINITY_DN2583_c0_g1_i1.p1 TRINITY_DN2583_c0_g1~~TRINITY_DN2583_c0_g1_i1.p1  ORF type:complete len:800 (+),score=176.79 TRINITY_DN2583_c0_g1_i1:276-2675(+)
MDLDCNAKNPVNGTTFKPRIRKPKRTFQMRGALDAPQGVDGLCTGNAASETTENTSKDDVHLDRSRNADRSWTSGNASNEGNHCKRNSGVSESNGPFKNSVIPRENVSGRSYERNWKRNKYWYHRPAEDSVAFKGERKHLLEKDAAFDSFPFGRNFRLQALRNNCSEFWKRLDSALETRERYFLRWEDELAKREEDIIRREHNVAHQEALVQANRLEAAEMKNQALKTKAEVLSEKSELEKKAKRLQRLRSEPEHCSKMSLPAQLKDSSGQFHYCCDRLKPGESSSTIVSIESGLYNSDIGYQRQGTREPETIKGLNHFALESGTNGVDWDAEGRMNDKGTLPSPNVNTSNLSASESLINNGHTEANVNTSKLTASESLINNGQTEAIHQTGSSVPLSSLNRTAKSTIEVKTEVIEAKDTDSCDESLVIDLNSNSLISVKDDLGSKEANPLHPDKGSSCGKVSNLLHLDEGSSVHKEASSLQTPFCGKDLKMILSVVKSEPNGHDMTKISHSCANLARPTPTTIDGKEFPLEFKSEESKDDKSCISHAGTFLQNSYVDNGEALQGREDILDHIFLKERQKLCKTTAAHTDIDSTFSNAHQLKSEYDVTNFRNSATDAGLSPQDDLKGENDLEAPARLQERNFQLKRKKKTKTCSIEKALEEDAPGLLEILHEKGFSVDQLKLYGDSMDEQASEIASADDNFQDLENLVEKIWGQSLGLIRMGRSRYSGANKPTYCLACLLSLIEQTRCLQLRNWPTEWGWCRELHSFIFVFERHNRLVKTYLWKKQASLRTMAGHQTLV